MNDFEYLVLISLIVVLVLSVCTIGIIVVTQKTLRKKEKELFTSVLSAQVNEQERIGRDLHDSIGPQLAGINAMVQSRLGLEGDATDLWLTNISNHLRKAGEEVRTTSHDLISVSFKEKGLVAAIEDLAQQWERPDLRISITSDFSSLNLDQVKLYQVYKVAAELLHNSCKHSKANSISQSFSDHNNLFVIEHLDNGVGYKEDFLQNNSKPGVGIKNIANRIKYLGGQINYSNRAEGGASALITIPIKQLKS